MKHGPRPLVISLSLVYTLWILNQSIGTFLPSTPSSSRRQAQGLVVGSQSLEVSSHEVVSFLLWDEGCVFLVCLGVDVRSSVLVEELKFRLSEEEDTPQN